MTAALWSALQSRVALVVSALVIMVAVGLAVAAPFLPLPDPRAMDAIPTHLRMRSTGSGPTISGATCSRGCSSGVRSSP